MTKDEYLQILEKELTRQLGRDEAQLVLDDYREYFAEGARDGLTEEALREQLGDPKMLARAAADERGIALSFRWRRLLGFLAFALVTCVGLVLQRVTASTYAEASHWLGSTIVVMVLLPVAFLVWYAYGKRYEDADKRYRSVTITIAAVLALLAIFWVRLDGWYAWQAYFTSFQSGDAIIPQEFFQSFAINRVLLFAIPLGGLVIVYLRALARGVDGVFALAFVLTALLQSYWCAICYLTETLSDAAHLIQTIRTNSVIFLVVGVLAAGVFLVLLHYRKRGRAHGRTA